MIIGEFHIGRIDKGSPYGGLLEVPNAKEAAEAYKKYMINSHSLMIALYGYQIRTGKKR